MAFRQLYGPGAWMTEGAKQRIVFIEPHGMLMEEHPSTSQKVNLHRKLQRELLAAREKAKNKNLMLDSFIISVAPYDDLPKKHGSEWDREKYAGAHVLFLSDDEDKAFLNSIFQEPPSPEHDTLQSQ